MNRRKFIKHSALVSIGGIIIPATFLSSCRKETLFEDLNYAGKVLIIGAGAAGLYAGYILKSKGIDFQILEATDKYGGRLGKLNGFADFPIDTGAQWLHGRNNILGDFITQSKTKITLDNSDEYYWFKNQLTTSIPIDLNAEFLLEGLPDVSYEEYAAQKNWGSDYKYVVENIAGDSGASASKISAYGKVKEEENWVSGDEDFKFEETYFDFIDSQIASHIKDKILLNTIVTKIDYSSDTITVSDSNNNLYTADKIIIAVPITILKSNSIAFIPSLAIEKMDAFNKIGMEAGMKVYLRFSNKFYNQNIIGGSICAAYADETIGKIGNDNVLLAFIMGAQAEYLNALGNDTAIINALLTELDTMYNGQATASYLNAFVQNWTNHPFIKGAYSYSTVGIGNSREVAAESIDNKLFFA
ncbi:MAG: FAD-dependent oxidoreductase, partial [Ignavibacteria bacterium]|nr:FAD-dependent oxidoreductase [Ignavibacteria bacterium]